MPACGRSALIVIAFLALPLCVSAKDPDCTGPNRWPANMAFVHLKNAGATNNDQLDFSKTHSSRVASEKIGKDLFRQVHLVTFAKKNGGTIEVLTVSDASHEECSMGPVDVFLISKHLGGK